MQPFEPLEYGKFYHIYNHGVGGRDLFCEPDNFEYFLSLYDKYISPVAETYAWVLMPNHFHLLVRIKENIVYKYSNADRSADAVRFEEIKWMTKDLSASEASDSVKIPKPHLHFSHLFNAYSKQINMQTSARGALFERPFRRKWVDTKEYLKQLVLYIHHNPVHHGFCAHPLDYPWSSYATLISGKPTALRRADVMEWFGGVGNFKAIHDKKPDWNELNDGLELK